MYGLDRTRDIHRIRMKIVEREVENFKEIFEETRH
jgi:hypothetical protein